MSHDTIHTFYASEDITRSDPNNQRLLCERLSSDTFTPHKWQAQEPYAKHLLEGINAAITRIGKNKDGYEGELMRKSVPCIQYVECCILYP
jgi:hypothetical protein